MAINHYDIKVSVNDGKPRRFIIKENFYHSDIYEYHNRKPVHRALNETDQAVKRLFQFIGESVDPTIAEYTSCDVERSEGKTVDKDYHD